MAERHRRVILIGDERVLRAAERLHLSNAEGEILKDYTIMVMELPQEQREWIYKRVQELHEVYGDKHAVHLELVQGGG